MASGTENAMSDIDIALLMDVTDDIVVRIKDLTNELGSLLDSSALDVVSLRDADIALRYNVISKGILFFERYPVKRIAFESRTTTEYLDMLPVIDANTVASRLATIEQCKRVIDRTKRKGLEHYLNDHDTRLLTERALHLAIEASSDIANHIIASRGYRRPTSYFDIFEILG